MDDAFLRWYKYVMNADRFTRLVKRKPFRPFLVRMADGQKLDVTHPESVLVLPALRMAAIATGDGGLELVNLPLVTSVRYERGSRRSG